jgi:WD40 repeat protein
LVVLPDGERVISAGNDAVLFFWDVGTGILVDRLVGHKTVIMGLTLSPDGHFVVSLGADQEIIVWDVELRKLLRRAAYSGNGFPAAAISPDSRLLALGDDTGIIRIVDLESGEECSQIETGGIGVTSLAFTPELEGTEIIAGCADGAIRIWPADMER